MRTLISVESEWPCSAAWLQRGGDADGEVAGDFFSADAFGGKREHVGGFVLAAELAVELADGGVGGEQDRDFALETDSGLRFGKKAGQRARWKESGDSRGRQTGVTGRQGDTTSCAARGRGPHGQV